MVPENPLRDMVHENVVPPQAVPFARMPHMTWAPSPSLFVLNRVREIVEKGIQFEEASENIILRLQSTLLRFTTT